MPSASLCHAGLISMVFHPLSAPGQVFAICTASAMVAVSGSE
jgi:hypothetical protein